MATQYAQLPVDATGVAGAVPGAGVPATGPAVHQPARRRRRLRRIVLAALLLVAASVGVVAALGLRKSPALAPAAQAAQALSAGLSAQTRGNTTAAAADYRQVLALDPTNQNALYNLGLLDQQAGRTAEAQAEYQQALAVDPTFEVALYNLAILVTPASPTEAVELYQRALALNPRDAFSHLNLGFLLESMGQKAQGASQFALAIGIDPSLRSRVPAAMLAAGAPAVTPRSGR